jgi:hypothetical protein
MASDNETNGNPPVDQWEYLYLSSREWRDRVAAKLGYHWRLLLTPTARQQFNEEHKQATEAVLNDLGREGWELVGMLPLLVVLLGSGGSFGSDAVFKRLVRRPEFPAKNGSDSGIKVLNG